MYSKPLDLDEMETCFAEYLLKFAAHDLYHILRNICRWNKVCSEHAGQPFKTALK
jgi:hypothetical protein